MCVKKIFVLFSVLTLLSQSLSAQVMQWHAMGLRDVNELVQRNRSVIIENLKHEVDVERVKQSKSERLPEILATGDGYLSQKKPLAHNTQSGHLWRYHANLYSEFELYSGGKFSNAVRRMVKEEEISAERLRSVEQEVNLRGYVLLYDIYRNLNYRDFIQKSIKLREKEFQRINEFFENGLVLKSDLLRSKLYITDLQKQEVEVQNSINILSDELRTLLGVEEEYVVAPQLANDLKYQLNESFDELFAYALENSPYLTIRHKGVERESILLKETRAVNRPSLKLYAQYGIGSPLPYYSYDHQIAGEVGFKLSFRLSSLYKNRAKCRAQSLRITQAEQGLAKEEEDLKNRLYALYTRYQESLLNIDRALEKIDMSKETMRILRNSYFNQQALLIDVLESETQSMQASFEWVEAVVDSQKYYWALKQICGYFK